MVTDSTGPLIELVKDSGATAPMTFRKEDLIEYRKSDSRNKHWVEVADGVKYHKWGIGLTLKTLVAIPTSDISETR